MSLTANIDNLNQQLNEQKAIMDNAQAVIVDLDEYIAHYISEKQKLGSITNKNQGTHQWYADKINDLKNQKVTQNNRYNAAKARYDQVAADLALAKKNLSPVEIQTITAQAQTDLSLAKAIESKMAQGTTKYLIWGAVALVVLGIVVIILRKKVAA